MRQVILGIFNFLIDSLKKLSKENDDLRQMLMSQMAQNAELRGIIRETRFAIEGLDKHLEETGYYKRKGTNGPFSLVKKAIEPSEKWV